MKDAQNSFTETLKQLRKTVDPNLVRQREGWRDRNGNVNMVEYLEWHTVADILDNVSPNWCHSVKDIRVIGEVCTVTVAITIDGITREGIGTGAAESELGIKKAEHDALKRAAVKFGIARDLYQKETEHIERGGSASNGYDNSRKPDNPIARNLGDLVTAKQLGMIRAIAREVGVDPDVECVSELNAQTDEISKKAASWLIQHLQELQKEKEYPQPQPFRREQSANGNSNGASVSPEVHGKLLVEEGRVSKGDDCYIVRDKLAGLPADFRVSKTGNIIVCTCKDYKSHGDDPGYYCAHKSAVRLFVDAKSAAA